MAIRKRYRVESKLEKKSQSKIVLPGKSKKARLGESSALGSLVKVTASPTRQIQGYSGMKEARSGHGVAMYNTIIQSTYHTSQHILDIVRRRLLIQVFDKLPPSA